MSALEQLLRANRDYGARFPGPLPPQPQLRLAIVTCMDCRLDPLAAFGLRLGDAHVLRNAGGIPTDDVLRSLAISQRALGTREVVLVHHTECGMQGFDDRSFRAQLTAETGAAPPWRVDGFADVLADTRSAVHLVRECAWLPHRDQVRGLVFDVAAAAVTEVG